MNNGAVSWRSKDGKYHIIDTNGKEITLKFNYGGLIEGRVDDCVYVGTGIEYLPANNQYIMAFTVGPYYGELGENGERKKLYSSLYLAFFSETGEYLEYFKVPSAYLNLYSANQWQHQQMPDPTPPMEAYSSSIRIDPNIPNCMLIDGIQQLNGKMTYDPDKVMYGHYEENGMQVLYEPSKIGWYTDTYFIVDLESKTSKVANSSDQTAFTLGLVPPYCYVTREKEKTYVYSSNAKDAKLLLVLDGDYSVNRLSGDVVAYFCYTYES